ncbi:hypothetical protein RHGRI_026700 [Rhododendron griersonianum]|uniref:Uncharacterized protein n=1 Tax=Rhododendron griersonianum TaxID=479676 RepID=A0AAV6ITV9_9ERIC|nr:hypothetical protein RHGRI_026700 [Rhododendron griersonianum]
MFNVEYGGIKSTSSQPLAHAKSGSQDQAQQGSGPTNALALPGNTNLKSQPLTHAKQVVKIMANKDLPRKFIQHFTSSANIELKLHRYGNQVAVDELNSLNDHSRAKGFGSEVKMRILMGTYALLAGYYDAYYKRSQQVHQELR